MRALWLRGGRLKVVDAPEPSPAAGEAVVRVLLAGICGTDLELVRGYAAMDGIPGHEFVGRVEAAPEAVWVGRRVVGEINASCGDCDACHAGRRSHCARRTVLGIRDRHGAFAERLTLPLSNLHAVPEQVSDEAAVFTEPLAAALEIQQQVPVGAGDRVLVIGDGRLGQLVAQSMSMTGCTLTVLGRHQSKLALLAGRGIRTAEAREGGSLPPERSADLVVDCTGSEQGLALALRLVRPRGTVVLKSTYHGGSHVDMSAVVVDEITLIGSRCGPFAPALDLIAAGAVEVRPLVHARYPLVDALVGFEHAVRPGALKVLLEP